MWKKFRKFFWFPVPSLGFCLMNVLYISYCAAEQTCTIHLIVLLVTSTVDSGRELAFFFLNVMGSKLYCQNGFHLTIIYCSKLDLF